MSAFTKCDVCLRTINERSAGWTTVVTRRFDQAVSNDVCGPACHAKWLADEYPARRPSFDETRAMLDEKRCGHAQRDEAAMAGEYDDVDEPETFEGEVVTAPFHTAAVAL